MRNPWYQLALLSLMGTGALCGQTLPESIHTSPAGILTRLDATSAEILYHDRDDRTIVLDFLITGTTKKAGVKEHDIVCVSYIDQGAQHVAESIELYQKKDQLKISPPPGGVGGVAVAQPTVYSREGAKAVETASATTAASNADTAANDAMHRAESLDSVVQSLDNYKSIADVTVTFQFDKAALSRDDKEQLDTFAAHMRYAKNYILEVTGGTDSTGSAAYDHDLSERRVDAVVEYLSSKHGIPVHRFYLIGIGKDQEVASDTTGEGRKQNRRVEIHLLTDMRDQIE